MKTTTGKNASVLLAEILPLASLYSQSERAALLCEHARGNNSFNKLIMKYIERMDAYTLDTTDGLMLFYHDYMSIKVLELVYTTWKNKKTASEKYAYKELPALQVLPGVFSPEYATDSYLWAAYMAQNNLVKDKTVLEMGAGSGIMSFYLNEYGHARRVVAADINPSAVATMLLNKNTLPSGDAVEVRTSDLYSNFKQEEKFDVIFWAYVWLDIDDGEMVQIIEKEQDQDIRQLLRSVTDPGYRMLERFLRESKAHLAKDGELYLIATDFLPNEKVKAMAERLGYRYDIKQFARQSEVVQSNKMILDLYHITLTLV